MKIYFARLSFLLSITFVAILPIDMEATANERVAISLPKGLSVSLSRDWVVLKDKLKIQLGQLSRKFLRLDNNDGPYSELVIMANLFAPNGKTSAMMHVRFYPDILTGQYEVQKMDKAGLKDFDDSMKAGITKSLNTAGFKLDKWQGTSRQKINGVYFLVTEYDRIALTQSGVFHVQLYRALLRKKSFTITLSALNTASEKIRSEILRIANSISIDGFPSKESSVPPDNRVFKKLEDAHLGGLASGLKETAEFTNRRTPYAIDDWTTLLRQEADGLTLTTYFKVKLDPTNIKPEQLREFLEELKRQTISERCKLAIAHDGYKGGVVSTYHYVDIKNDPFLKFSINEQVCSEVKTNSAP
jgi:hypothetical protein